jgi:hypothetical protein
MIALSNALLSWFIGSWVVEQRRGTNGSATRPNAQGPGRTFFEVDLYGARAGEAAQAGLNERDCGGGGGPERRLEQPGGRDVKVPCQKQVACEIKVPSEVKVPCTKQVPYERQVEVVNWVKVCD